MAAFTALRLVSRHIRCFANFPSAPHGFRFSRRFLQTGSVGNRPHFAFAFDVDGVLLRSSRPILGAQKALLYLQNHQIPFILLTNGGGKSESERVAELSEKLQVPLHNSMFVQSHTPFVNMLSEEDQDEQMHWRDKCILVVGGDGGKCRDVAASYGFRNVVTPGDIFIANPSVWPFARVFRSYYESFAKPLPKPIDFSDPGRSLKIDGIFVYNDPRDWALDAQIMLDLLLSRSGILGTLSPTNNNPELPNRGFLQDGQPPLFYSNPDLWWASDYPLPRLGQGGFREAFDGLWTAATGGPEKGVKLDKTIIGKPYQGTYEFAEKRLREHKALLHRTPTEQAKGLSEVFMVGDNPYSDIQGANEYKSPWSSRWTSILVRTGVYAGEPFDPVRRPKLVVEDVWDAVRAGLSRAGWEAPK